jgi:hypothetical protein
MENWRFRRCRPIDSHGVGGFPGTSASRYPMYVDALVPELLLDVVGVSFLLND